MKKALKVIGILAGVIILLAVAAGFYVKEALPDVGPAPAIKAGITPARIARGRYLCTNVAGCMVCHSTRDTGRFAGPVEEGSLGKGGELFGHDEGLPGDIYAPNLTPYHLRSWTDGELFRAIATGVSKDGHALFPLMNYPAYGRMDTEDMLSIIAYLRTLPAISNDVPATKLDFPVSLIVNTMPAAAAPASQPDSNDAVAYGKYLVTMASCVDCHSPVDKGRVIAGREFSGGRDFSSGGHSLFSPNLTPDMETGIGTWTRGLFVRRFRQYADSGLAQQRLPAGAAKTPMPWTAFAGMTAHDLGAIYAYLHSVKPIRNRVSR
ncbi:MAG TPA: c-type cytochrome [Puia sp.]|nr:c-type cytochrome [Puia sp.]